MLLLGHTHKFIFGGPHPNSLKVAHSVLKDPDPFIRWPGSMKRTNSARSNAPLPLKSTRACKRRTSWARSGGPLRDTSLRHIADKEPTTGRGRDKEGERERERKKEGQKSQQEKERKKGQQRKKEETNDRKKEGAGRKEGRTP